MCESWSVSVGAFGLTHPTAARRAGCDARAEPTWRTGRAAHQPACINQEGRSSMNEKAAVEGGMERLALNCGLRSEIIA
eukprot:4588567-Prymnesium_polylepis.1